MFKTAAELLTQVFITSKRLCCIECFPCWTQGASHFMHDRNTKYRNAIPVFLTEASVRKDVTFEQDFQK